MGKNKYFHVLTSDAPITEEKIVTCKECRIRGELECPMYFEYGWDEYYDGPIIVDNTTDDGYCDRGIKDE